MRIAYLECFSGVSGDMFMGALIDAGVPPRVLEEAVAALGVGARLEISRVVRSGISATKVDVRVDGEEDLPREEYWAKQDVARAESPAKAQHKHEHHHDDGHHHDHEHSSEAEISRDEPFLGLPRQAPAAHEHPHSHQHGSGLTEIRGIIAKAGISDRAKKTAIVIFEALGA